VTNASAYFGGFTDGDDDDEEEKYFFLTLTSFWERDLRVLNVGGMRKVYINKWSLLSLLRKTFLQP
jgi:hypothetical protein